MTFDYNTTRKKLILAEYGRNVQNMVKYIVDLPTKFLPQIEKHLNLY